MSLWWIPVGHNEELGSEHLLRYTYSLGTTLLDVDSFCFARHCTREHYKTVCGAVFEILCDHVSQCVICVEITDSTEGGDKKLPSCDFVPSSWGLAFLFLSLSFPCGFFVFSFFVTFLSEVVNQLEVFDRSVGVSRSRTIRVVVECRRGKLQDVRVLYLCLDRKEPK